MVHKMAFGQDLYNVGAQQFGQGANSLSHGFDELASGSGRQAAMALERRRMIEQNRIAREQIQAQKEAQRRAEQNSWARLGIGAGAGLAGGALLGGMASGVGEAGSAAGDVAGDAAASGSTSVGNGIQTATPADQAAFDAGGGATPDFGTRGFGTLKSIRPDASVPDELGAANTPNANFGLTNDPSAGVEASNAAASAAPKLANSASRSFAYPALGMLGGAALAGGPGIVDGPTPLTAAGTPNLSYGRSNMGYGRSPGGMPYSSPATAPIENYPSSNAMNTPPQGGAAPLDPAQRQSGAMYMTPDGKLRRWAGFGWEGGNGGY